jgi:SAM-dependent methyltransferase
MLREIRELISYHSNSQPRLAEHDVRNVYEKAIRDLKQFGFSGIKGKKVLDLGCGQRFTFSLQCVADGAEVTALDLNYMKPDFLPLAFCRLVKYNGIKRALKSLVRRVFWDDKYYQALEASAGKPLRPYQRNINFIVADPISANYPLPDASFALIASNAVLEHVDDVPKFAKEVERLLESGGYFYGIIHNYFSLSGGHNLDWAFADEKPPADVPPWDHLRENRFPTWAFINRLKPEQYKDAFTEHLEVVSFEGVGINHDIGELEGERFLTPEIEAELKEYPRDLLLTRAWRIVCKKK